LNGADFAKASALGCNDFNALQCDFPTEPIREIFAPSRETAGSNFSRTGNLAQSGPMVAINPLPIFKNIRWLDETARINVFYGLVAGDLRRMGRIRHR
jgi:hypothetical protein